MSERRGGRRRERPAGRLRSPRAAARSGLVGAGKYPKISASNPQVS